MLASGAGPMSGGYGVITVAGKTASAARVYYAAARGPIPAGVRLRRRCDRPACVNPDHLEPGPGGAPPTKLADADVRSILAVGTTVPMAEVAQRYGVTPSMIHHILSGRRRAAVAPELARPLATHARPQDPGA